MAEKKLAVFQQRKIAIFLIACALSLVFTQITFSSTNENIEGKILYLNSYHKGYLWSDQITEGIEEIFSGEDVDLFIEFIDTKRHTGIDYYSTLAEFLRAKYDQINLDVIITSDNNAFEFVKTYRGKLFSDIPIVFCGLNNLNENDYSEIEQCTGIGEVNNLPGNIDLIQSIHNECQRILIITDNTTTGKRIQEEYDSLKKIEKNDQVKLDIVYDLSIDELSDTLKNLNSKTIPLLTFFFRDNANKFFDYNVFSTLVTEASNVPVYSNMKFNLNYGIVGGQLNDGYLQGKIAAQKALEILNGKNINDIPVENRAIYSTEFDYKVLIRHNISLANLPGNSLIINKPISFYSQYKQLVWLTFVTFLSVLIALATTLLGYLRVNKTKKQTEQISGNLKAILESIGEGVVATNLDGKITHINHIAKVMTGFRGENVSGLSLLDVFQVYDLDSESRINILENEKESTNEKIGFDPVVRLISAGSHKFMIKYTLSPTLDEAENIIGSVLTFRDVTQEINLQESIERNEELLNAVFNSIQDGISVLDDDLKIIKVNRKMEQWYEDAVPLIGKKCANCYHTADKRMSPCPTRRSVNSGKAETDVIPALPNSEMEWLEIRSYPINDRETGRINGIVEIVRDISSQITKDKLIVENERRQKYLLNHANSVIFIKDLEGCYEFVNHAYEKIFGVKDEEIRGKTDYDFFPEEFAKKYRENDLQVIEGDKSLEIEEITPVNGEFKHFISLKFPLKDVENRTYAVCGIATDITQRIAVENELKKNINFINGLLNATPAAVFYKDREGKYLGCNQTFTDLMGVTNEDIKGKTVFEVWPQDKSIHFHKKDIELMENPGKQIYKFPLMTKDLGERTVLFVKDVFRDIDNEVGGIVGAFIDITDQIKVKEELAEQTKFIELIVTHMPNEIFWKNRDSVYLGCNDAFAKLAKMKSAKEVIGKVDYELGFTDHEVEGFLQWDKKVMESQKPELNIEESYTQEDGSTGWLWTSKIPILNDNNESTGILGICIDVSDLKNANLALRHSEEKFRSIIEQSQDAVYIFQNSNFVFINKRFVELTGLTQKEINDEKFDIIDLIVDEYKEIVRGRINNWDKITPVPSINEYQIKNVKSGIVYSVQASTTQIIYNNEKAILSFVRDISKVKMLEQQLLQTQKMESVGHLAGGIAHDFNNLLTPIIGNSELAILQIDSSHPIVENLEEINDTAMRAAELTRQLLAFSRQQVLDVKTININKLISEFQKILIRTLREDINLIFELSDSIGMIKADKSQIEQILMNLVVNARDALEKGGLISVRTNRVEYDDLLAENHLEVTPGEYVMLSVDDSGTGIAEEALTKIFDPFYTSKEVGKGTGLGLSTVHGIVKQHNGHIWVYSEVGKGTSFKIIFPVEDEGIIEDESNMDAENDFYGKGEILVVEDQKNVLKISSKILEKFGYTVTKANNAEEALLLLKKNYDKYELLLTDLIMPGRNGRELYEEARKLNPELLVIYMSGYSKDVIAHHGILENDITFIQKPLTVKLLMRAVTEKMNEN